MVNKIEEPKSKIGVVSAVRIALLETGARVEVPLFIEVGDVIKIHTKTNEFVQRI